ncbi:zinc finger, RING/FYVE/PHD-type [Artemisia annua]|uniref:Zinc finger, RING/FYVE/PHD-type n=1 Tax=Artemisia annua TaxID=35608 RepID=A0A2U1N1S3_ARTAN|nr:zinc finger, RING/FYVE/PHD-type [Artemisia annua]
MVVASSSPLADVITTADNSSSPSSPSLGCASSVPCSICFDLVIDDGDRSIAKLNCGFCDDEMLIAFRLGIYKRDCIGSAFNTKGSMQCPNCRKVESGRWLFANGSAHAISEDDTLDWLQTDYYHDLSHSRRYLTFSILVNLFREAESSLNTCKLFSILTIYILKVSKIPNFHGNRAMTIENTSAPSSARSHVSHFRPNEHIGNSNFNHPHHPMNAHSAPHDTLRSTNIQHPSWGWNCHYLPYSDRELTEHNNLTPVNPATLRPTHARVQADAAARSSSFPHPLRYSQQPIARPGERSVANSQPTETTNTPSSGNAFRRFSGARAMPMIMPAVPNRIYFRHSGGGLYFRDMERDESFSHAVPAGFRRVSRSSNSSNRAQWF